MKRMLCLLVLLYSSASLGQETTIRILGVYPSHLSLSSSQMTSHLQMIASAWNLTDLPSTSVTTVQLLNSAVAVPVVYPNVPGLATTTSQVAYQQSAISNARRQYQADVVVLFTNHNERCGATAVHWANNNFVADGQGLDLSQRNVRYILVVNPTCDPIIAAHEFGHLLGGGHYVTDSRLFSDGRALYFQIPLYFNGVLIGYAQFITALGDPSDVPQQTLTLMPFYSSDAAGGHDNRRTLGYTARSVANFFEYPSGPPILNPPVNVHGFNLGCVDGVATRHDLYWSDDPGTTAVVTHYEVWKSQPIGQPFVLGWTVVGPFSQSFVWGADARARVKACSNSVCSDMSITFYDAQSICSGF